LFAHILDMLEDIFFIFEMWPPFHLHCKLGTIWIRHHRATYICVKIATLLFLSKSLLLCTPHFLGPHNTLPCVLIILIKLPFWWCIITSREGSNHLKRVILFNYSWKDILNLLKFCVLVQLQNMSSSTVSLKLGWATAV